LEPIHLIQTQNLKERKRKRKKNIILAKNIVTKTQTKKNLKNQNMPVFEFERV